jgi:hypothetical protein
MSIFTVKAQGNSNWITSYQIYDYSTKALLVRYDSTTGVVENLSTVLPNQGIYVTFTVNVLVAGTGNLQLQSGLQKLPAKSGEIWALDTQNYDLGAQFNPNSNPTQFTWVQGTFTMTAYGTMPDPSSTGQSSVDVVSVLGPSGSALQKITISATSSAMAAFNAILSRKQSDLKSLTSSGVDSGYTSLLSTVLTQAKAEAAAGDVTGATNLLNALNTSNAPAGSTLQALFIPLIVVVAVVAALFAFMFMRIRGKVSYIRLVVEDQIKDLEGLTMRISRIDRQSASNLESVEDRLKRLVGA